MLALVGGRDYRVSQFNRAVQAHRQAGSLFKPFVYLAAFEASRTGTPPYMTPASLLADEPVTFESEGVTLRSALEQSLNVPAVRVAKGVGTQPIVDVIRQLGVTSALTNDLSLALGSPAVSLLDMVTAYGVLANRGIWVHPTSLRAISDRDGLVLWTPAPDRRQGVSPQAAYLAAGGCGAARDGCESESLGLDRIHCRQDGDNRRLS
jgi:penicillin-binding protein 1B